MVRFPNQSKRTQCRKQLATAATYHWSCVAKPRRWVPPLVTRFGQYNKDLIVLTVRMRRIRKMKYQNLCGIKYLLFLLVSAAYTNSASQHPAQTSSSPWSLCLWKLRYRETSGASRRLPGSLRGRSQGVESDGVGREVRRRGSEDFLSFAFREFRELFVFCSKKMRI